jgi:hypothetical protein
MINLLWTHQFIFQLTFDKLRLEMLILFILSKWATSVALFYLISSMVRKFEKTENLFRRIILKNFNNVFFHYCSKQLVRSICVVIPQQKQHFLITVNVCWDLTPRRGASAWAAVTARLILALRMEPVPRVTHSFFNFIKLNDFG